MLSINLIFLLFSIVTGFDYGYEFIHRKTTELPEYSEYLRRQGLTRPPSSVKPQPLQKDSPLQFPLPLPGIQLCKDRPADDDSYGKKRTSFYANRINLGHLFCWAIFILYGMAVFSLIIYQLRSIFWLRLHASKKSPRKQQNESGYQLTELIVEPDGQSADNNNIALESHNK